MSIDLAQTAKVSVDVLGDCLSAPRNIVNGVTKGSAAILPTLVFAQGILAFLGGVHTTATSFVAIKAAHRKGDQQGVTLNSLGTLAGLAQMTLGTAATTTGAATLAGKSLIAAGAGAAITPALLGIYALFLAKSALTLKHVHTFKKALSKSDDEVKAFLIDELEKNPEHVKRMLGDGVADQIAGLPGEKQINMILLKACITRECLKQNITHALVIFICSVGILATIASFVLAMSCPLLAPVLFAIGATLWIFVDLTPLHLKLRDAIVNNRLGPLPKEALPQIEPIAEEV